MINEYPGPYVILVPVLCRVRALTHPDLSLIGALLIRRSASLRGVVVGEAGRPAEGRSTRTKERIRLTTMDYLTTIRAVKKLKVQTGSLACMGCGYEHNCSLHGCAILRNAAEYMEAALAMYDHLNSLLDQMEQM